MLEVVRNGVSEASGSEARTGESMRLSQCGLAVLTAANLCDLFGGWYRNLFGGQFCSLLCGLLCTLPAGAAESGWTVNQITLAQGTQQVLLNAHAAEIKFPKQRCRVYSFAPKWNVIYINDQVGTYIDFSRQRFFGSIIGRLGSQLGSDIQMMTLPRPQLVKEKGLEFALYDQKFKLTPDERARLHQIGNSSVMYSIRALKAKYLRLNEIPNQIKELVCRLSGVPMCNDLPLQCSCKDGFRQENEILVTSQMRKEKAIEIAPPDLKNLKPVKSEAELFNRNRVSDVFELFGDAPGEKKGKAGK